MSILSAVTGMDDRKKAGRTADQQSSLIQEQIANARAQAALAAKYQGPLMDSLFAQSNINPADVGTNNPNLGAARAGFDHGADNAVQATQDDFASRGFGGNENGGTGTINPGLASAVGNIRSNEASNWGAWVGNAIQENQARKTALQQSLLSTTNGLSMGAQSELGTGSNELGGLAGMYSNNANAALGQLTSIGNLIATGGKRGVNAGNNTLGTNQTVRPITYYQPPASGQSDFRDINGGI